MKTNVQQPHKNRGITLIEITLVIALILGLTAVGAFGLSAYKKGSNAATCLTQQQRILKTAIGMAMHEIDSSDQGGSVTQRSKIITEFSRETISPLYQFSQTLRCPGNTSTGRKEVLNHLFGTEDENEIAIDYGMTADELMTSWYGSVENAMTQIDLEIRQYTTGVIMLYNANVNMYNFLKEYGVIIKPLGKTTLIYVACQRTWYSYYATKNAKNKIEYHANW